MEFIHYNNNDFMFEFISLIIIVVFIIIIGFIIFKAIQNTAEWNKNNNSLPLIVDAKVISKRMDVSQHANMNNRVSATTYYATFEFNEGNRAEFKLSPKKYGLIAEGDEGKLNFQGSRFNSFERYL